jgi:hypothetical protein
VNSFFSDNLDKRYRKMLGLNWSKEFADTTRYTNASLYNSVLASIENPGASQAVRATMPRLRSLSTISFRAFNHANPLILLIIACSGTPGVLTIKVYGL